MLLRYTCSFSLRPLRRQIRGTVFVLVSWTVEMGRVVSNTMAGIVCFAEYGSDGDFRWRHVANLY